MAPKAPPAILAEFAEDRREWNVRQEIGTAERTIELGCALTTQHISEGQASDQLKQVRGAQLDLLRKALGIRSGSVQMVRNRIAQTVCGFTKAGL